ncbi:MAG: DNA translocase FtsK 4TM domain-containing protein [Proteobacteria bacterium]|nr:DNA translocase FtsK 4TM domain-containing protein [Pseudomonadota bacterium]MBU2227693.1 DNA translocase FtsK 4TM domain-containing protein [Pseudomonadota bacterium]MBU2260426.1 DNA translocase FtsK 4TM domain-containing protein [Pseudomonadota bacterium]
MNEKHPFGKRAAEIAGVSCLALALFLLLALFSYHPDDPSFTRFVPENAPLHNWTGAVGSYTADTLIRLTGIGILWLPAMLLVVALRYFRDPQFRIGAAAAVGMGGLVFATSSFFALLIGNVEIYGSLLDTGGLLGTAAAGILNAYLRLAGSLIALTLVLVIALMIMFDFSVVRFAARAAAMAAAAARLGKSFLGNCRERLGGKREAPAVTRQTAIPAPTVPEERQESLKEKLKKAEQTRFDFASRVSGKFQLPPLTLLDHVERKDTRIKRENLIANSRILEKKLSDFGVEGKVTEVKPGPVITMYELEPAPGVKINKITNLSDDLALALRAQSIRIIAPIPGKGAVGIEIPNHERESVRLRNVLDNAAFKESPCRLPIALGEDIVGAPVITDLIRMPHLLIAGTTGSGKSVSLNAMICSILFKIPPDEAKFLMIDTKRLELSGYEGIPHLLHPVVVDPKKAALVLRWAVEEMERRYRIISEVGVKSIEAYNQFHNGQPFVPETAKPADDRKKEGGQPAASAEEISPAAPGAKQGAQDGQEKKAPLPGRLPYIIIIIDELADLMMVAQRNVEESLARLAQMARAAGIHLILATQRPSVDVITGIIKANFPTRISFKVSSKVDSRTILDQLGAEKLLGDGDMLFIPPGSSALTRIHGAYVSDREIERIVDFVKKQGKPAYDESIAEYEPKTADEDKPEEDFDEKYDEAVELVTDLGQASISLVQRYMKIGYNRAARIIERMEAEGIVGASDGAKPRKVLAHKLPR